MKQCSKCKEYKPDDNYYRWSGICKPCKNLEAKKNRQKNQEHYRAKWKEYYKNKTGKKIERRIRISTSTYFYTHKWQENPEQFTELFRKNGYFAWGNSHI